jgi:hypothetical protein
VKEAYTPRAHECVGTRSAAEAPEETTYHFRLGKFDLHWWRTQTHGRRADEKSRAVAEVRRHGSAQNIVRCCQMCNLIKSTQFSLGNFSVCRRRASVDQSGRGFPALTFGALLPQVRQMQDILYMLMGWLDVNRPTIIFAAARCACATQHNPATLYPGRERLDVRTACLLQTWMGRI